MEGRGRFVAVEREAHVGELLVRAQHRVVLLLLLILLLLLRLVLLLLLRVLVGRRLTRRRSDVGLVFDLEDSTVKLSSRGRKRMRDEEVSET